jgi:hypothetical protein
VLGPPLVSSMVSTRKGFQASEGAFLYASSTDTCGARPVQKRAAQTAWERGLLQLGVL